MDIGYNPIMEVEKMNKKDLMYQRIEKHGNDLIAIFPSCEFEPIELCKKLRRLENKLDRINTDYCNGTISEEDQEALEYEIILKLRKVLNSKCEYPFYFNRDPRGYAIKLDDDYVRDNNIQIYRDMGGYGIIAPDLS